jgi:hypothetical protein
MGLETDIELVAVHSPIRDSVLLFFLLAWSEV